MNQKGFTLIELLIVIVIIGILASVGVGMFEQMQNGPEKQEAFLLSE